MKKIFGILLALVLCAAVCCGTAETAAAADLYGTTDGDVYENSFAGIGCRLEGWSFKTREQIDQQNRAAMEKLGEALDQTIEEANAVIVMAAEDAYGRSNVSVSVSDISAHMDEFAEVGMEGLLEDGAATTSMAFVAMGMKDAKAEITSVTIGAETFGGIYASFIYPYMGSEIPVYQKQIVWLKDSCLIYIMATSYLSDATDEILGCFYLLDE